MKSLLYIPIFLAIVLCCENNKSDNHPENESKSKITEEWIEIAPCDSCRTLIFREDGLITQKHNLSNSTVSASYKIIADDSIEVTRNWEIEQEKKITNNKFIFHAEDTLEIENYLPVDYGITGFVHIKLFKK